MALVKWAVCGVSIDRREYDDDKSQTDDDNGNANKCELPSNSVSANALRFRIRSVSGDMYIYGLYPICKDKNKNEWMKALK